MISVSSYAEAASCEVQDERVVALMRKLTRRPTQEWDRRDQEDFMRLTLMVARPMMIAIGQYAERNLSVSEQLSESISVLYERLPALLAMTDRGMSAGGVVYQVLKNYWIDKFRRTVVRNKHEVLARTENDLRQFDNLSERDQVLGSMDVVGMDDLERIILDAQPNDMYREVLCMSLGLRGYRVMQVTAIARHFNRSAQRIWQIKRAGLARAREALRRSGLMEDMLAPAE